MKAVIYDIKPEPGDYDPYRTLATKMVFLGFYRKSPKNTLHYLPIKRLCNPRTKPKYVAVWVHTVREKGNFTSEPKKSFCEDIYMAWNLEGDAWCSSEYSETGEVRPGRERPLRPRAFRPPAERIQNISEMTKALFAHLAAV